MEGRYQSIKKAIANAYRFMAGKKKDVPSEKPEPIATPAETPEPAVVPSEKPLIDYYKPFKHDYSNEMGRLAECYYKSLNLEREQIGIIYTGIGPGARLCGKDMRGMDLSGRNLAGADLSGADLTGANLEDAVLIGANLKNTVLDDANLKGASFMSPEMNLYIVR